MSDNVRFSGPYFVIAAVLFSVEVVIASVVHDQFVRPYVGDFLVVILLYCFVRSFLDIPYRSTAIAVLLFSFLLEILQYVNIVDRLGLGWSALARTVIGTSFQWIDLLAYTLGVALVIYVENKLAKPTNRLDRKVP